MNYNNFDLSIESLPDNRYAVKLHSHMGEAEGELLLKSNDPNVITTKEKLAARRVTGEQLISFGKFLFQHLFTGNIHNLYRMALGDTFKKEEEGVRIRLAIIPPEISALPWELIYDPLQDCFLATSVKSPLVRYVHLPAPIRELKVEPPVKVLIVIPEGSGLDVSKEIGIIKQALTALQGALVFKIIEGRATTARIFSELNADRYHIFHFIGHGAFQNDEGYLLINSEAGENQPISARAFAQLFSSHPYMKLVVLNSCQGATDSTIKPFTGLAPQLVRQGIPAVIAMQRAILDSTAISFSRGFYTKLCMGWDRGRVDTAISHARSLIYIDRPEAGDFAVPTLFMRSATGVIFDLDSPKAQPKWRLTIKDIHRLLAVKRTREINLDALQQSDGPASPAVAAEKHEIAIISGLLRQWKSGLALAATSALVFFAFWVGLFNVFGLDQRIEKRLSRYFDLMVGTDTVLIVAEEDPEKNGPLGSPGPDWRQHHARLIDALSRAGTKVIAFDLFLEEPTEWDQLLGQAIRQASDRGTTVILGTRQVDFNGTHPSPYMSPALMQFIAEDNWGTLRGDALAQKLQLASFAGEDLPDTVEILERPVVASLALQIARQTESQAQGKALTIIYNAEESRIDLRDQNAETARGIPVDRDLNLLFNLAGNLESHPYHQVLANLNDAKYLEKFYKDKIVIVGYRTEADLRAVTDSEKRYGVEIQVSAIITLLHELYVQRLRPVYQYLIVLLMGVIAWLLQTVLRRWMRYKVSIELPYLKGKNISLSLLLVTALYLLTALSIYDRYHMILAINYHVVGLWLAYWTIGLARQRRAAEV